MLLNWKMNTIKEYIPFYKRNLKIALPIVFSQLGGAVVQLVDTFMVGRLGTVELAAVSFASAVFAIGYVFSIGILLGATPIIGQAYVRGEKQTIVELFQNSLVLATLAALVIGSLLYLTSFFMDNMGQVDAVVELAIPYFLVLVVSLIPHMYFFSIKQFLEGLGNTKVAMWITIIANLINVLFNYLLIFGKYGFPELGVLGAGVSTLIARASMPVLYVIWLRLKPEWWSYCKDFRWSLFSWVRLKQLLAMGLPIAAHILLEVSAFAFSGVMIGWLGAAPLAGHQIANNMSHMAFMVVMGISSATTIRVSHQLGARNIEGLKMAAMASVHLCLLANAIMGTLLIVFRVQIAQAFSTDPEVISVGSQVLVMAGIFQLADGMQAVGAGILRGLTDVKIIMLYAFIAYICINIPLGYVLAFVCGFGAVGIWAAFIFGLGTAAILFHVRYHKVRKRIFAELQEQVIL